MSCNKWICLTVVAVMATTLLCGRLTATSVSAGEPSAAELLAQAEAAKATDTILFGHVLSRLHQHRERLTTEQQRHLQFLDAWQLSFNGDYGKADPILVEIINHSADLSLSTRATARLVLDKFLTRDYVSAYALANTLMVELPKVTDPVARMEAIDRISTVLNSSAVGQYDLALQYSQKLKALDLSPAAQCVADMLEMNSLFYSGKITSADPRSQQAIDTCVAADRPFNADSLRLDLAGQLVYEGQGARAIEMLQRMAPALRKTHYPPYLASLPVTLAQAYLSLGDVEQARKFALDSMAVTGTNSPLWTVQAAYKVLYEAAKLSGNDHDALMYYEKYVAADKVAMADSKARALAYQMVSQQVEAKRMKLDALSKQNSILQLRQALTSQAQRTSQLLIVLLLVVLAFITLAMVWLRRSQLRFRNMARHDGLTGAFNREHFFEEARGTLRRLCRTKTSVCLVVLDLDHFKQVNDTYGHAAGDVVLRHAVAACQGELRGSDVFGRLGGEEFGLLMPGCSREQGVEIATRIRLALAGMPMVLDSQTTIHVSASFGLVCSPCSELTLHQLLRQADLALYRAKGSGRNRLDVSADASTKAPADVGVATHA